MEHKQLYPVKWEKRCLFYHIAAARVNAVTSWSVSNKSYTALTYALLTYATVHQEVLDLIPKLIQKVSLVFLKKKPNNNPEYGSWQCFFFDFVSFLVGSVLMAQVRYLQASCGSHFF